MLSSNILCQNSLYKWFHLEQVHPTVTCLFNNQRNSKTKLMRRHEIILSQSFKTKALKNYVPMH